jgi:hypothetical protein
MGWANCGTDSKGRPIGYAHGATCDHPECSTPIDRGLAFACGGMHGDNEYSCENYFCSEHLTGFIVAHGLTVSICAACEKALYAHIRQEAGCTCSHEPEAHGSTLGCLCDGEDGGVCLCLADRFEWKID